jgi:hypothetical protein
METKNSIPEERYIMASPVTESRTPRIMTAATIALLITILLAGAVLKTVNEQTVTATVTDKGIETGRGYSTYLIYAVTDTGETAVYEVTDSLLRQRFDSSEAYAGIETGKTYAITTCGYRVPLLGLYPNIYGFTEIVTEP